MHKRCRPLLGTFVEITADNAAAVEAGFEAIGRVHRLMSAHEPDSDVSRVNRFAHLRAIEVDAWTMLVLERALFWSRQSKGAFDVVRAGKAALESGLLPRHADQPVPAATHWTWLELRGGAVRLLRPACLDLGGIAKGFAVDRAVEAMKAEGAGSGLVNAGGDLACFGGKPWTIEVIDPVRRQPAIEIRLQGEALATSALNPAGSETLSRPHLVDCAPDWISASVRAPTCMDGDALTKIVLAASEMTSRCLTAVGAEALVMRRDGHVEAIGAKTLAA